MEEEIKERIARLEVRMQNAEENLKEITKLHTELLERISTVEKRIAVYTGGLVVIVYLVEHAIRYIK